jgi:hypothetical protein
MRVRSTTIDSALGKADERHTGESPVRPEPQRAGSEPSLAGVAVTRRPKRRQGLCGVRGVSPERLKVVEAEAVVIVEGRVCAIARRDGDAPPGSGTVSRAKGQRRNPRGPAGAAGVVACGGASRGITGAVYRAEAGSRTDQYY